MSEARSGPRGGWRDVSATEASRNGAAVAVSRSARSRDALSRPARAGTGPAPAKPSPAPAPSVPRSRSRDVSGVEPSSPPARAGRRGADPSARSRDASGRTTAAAPAAVTPAAQPNTSRSRDASAKPVLVGASERAGFTCPPCGRFVPTEVDGIVLRARTGSPARFCSPRCRQAAYRRRQAGVGEDVALQLRGGRDRSLAGRNGAGDE